MIETYGLDLTEEEQLGLREAITDAETGNDDAFISFEELERELECTK